MIVGSYNIDNIKERYQGTDTGTDVKIERTVFIMKTENTVSREVVVALLSQKYCGDNSVGERVVNPKLAIRNAYGKCIGYAKYTLNDLCNRTPADEWMELVVRGITRALFADKKKLAHCLCRDFEMLTRGLHVEYYKKSIIEDILYYGRSLIEVKKYNAGDTGFSLHRMSVGEFHIMSLLQLVDCDLFTKEVYNIMCRIRDIYSQNPDGTLDYFLGFSMSESEFMNFTKSRFGYNRTIREV